MPHIPDYVPIPWAQTLQKWVIGTGVLGGLGAAGCFSDNLVAPGMVFGAASVGLLFVASKIKTRKRYVGGTGRYR